MPETFEATNWITLNFWEKSLKSYKQDTNKNAPTKGRGVFSYL